MDRHIGPAFADHHDQSRIRHDQRIGLHVDDRFHIFEVTADLEVVRGDVAGDVEFFAQLVCFGDRIRHDIQFVEFVFPYTETVTGLSRVDGIRPEGVSVLHGFTGSGWGKQFRFGCRHRTSHSQIEYKKESLHAG